MKCGLHFHGFEAQGGSCPLTGRVDIDAAACPSLEAVSDNYQDIPSLAHLNSQRPTAVVVQ